MQDGEVVRFLHTGHPLVGVSQRTHADFGRYAFERKQPTLPEFLVARTPSPKADTPLNIQLRRAWAFLPCNASTRAFA
jgi:hypothetical protein